MDASPFTWSERRALRRLARRDGRCRRDALRPAQAEKFLRLGLIADVGEDFRLTLKGQVEALRQLFRGWGSGPEPALVAARGAPPDAEIYRLPRPPRRLAA